MKKRRVVVKGGGRDLFQVSYSYGTFSVYQVEVGFFDNFHQIGSTDSLEDALSLIRSYSGKEIKRISSW